MNSERNEDPREERHNNGMRYSLQAVPSLPSCKSSCSLQSPITVTTIANSLHDHAMAVKLLDEALAKIDLLLARFSLPVSESSQAAPTAAAPTKTPAGIHILYTEGLQAACLLLCENLRGVAAKL